MKRMLKNKLIVFLLAILSLFVLAGCSMGDSLQDVLENNDLKAQVTYYANGGVFENSKTKKDIYYKADSKILNLGVVNPTSGSVNVTRDNYELAGWYHVTKVVDESKGLCELGEQVDFTSTIAAEEHWTIAAKWRALEGLRVVMVCDEDSTIVVDKNINAVEGAKSFKNGDVIGEIDYDSKDTVTSSATPDNKLFTVKDKTHTFYGFYMDAECTTPVEFPIKRGETQQTVYAKYIEGNWTFVRTARDVSSMFSALRGGANKQYYLMNDIDCSSVSSVDMITTFAGEIQGNGYKISNLTINKTLTAGDNKASLFGNMKAMAIVENITFENVTINVSMRTAFHLEAYLVFVAKEANAKVSNVNVSGSMTVDLVPNAVIDNMQANDVMSYENCLFGGYTTDSEYVTTSEGKEFVVTGNPEDMITIK